MSRPARVRLEPGCGAQCSGGDVADVTIGVDVDLEALRTVLGGAPVVCGDAARLPLADGSVHEVVLRAVLHHLDPVERALAELARVAAPDAGLTVIDGVALPPERARRLTRELLAAGRHPESIAGFDLDELSAAVARHGFVVDAVRLDGTATFATKPIVSEDYVTDRFVLEARRRSSTSK